MLISSPLAEGWGRRWLGESGEVKEPKPEGTLGGLHPCKVAVAS